MSIDHLLMLFRPLLTVPEAMWMLGNRSRQSVWQRLKVGTLRGVDISARGETGERRELRIYRYSVEHFFVAPGSALGRPPVECIFPHHRETLRLDEVAQLLNCAPRHVTNLALAGPRVRRRELIEFLEAREVGGGQGGA